MEIEKVTGLVDLEELEEQSEVLDETIGGVKTIDKPVTAAISHCAQLCMVCLEE